MNYWYPFCLIMKFLPGFYFLGSFIDPLIEYIKYNKFYNPFESYISIILLLSLQILLFIFLKEIEISEDSIIQIKPNSYDFISWNEVESIKRIGYSSPVIYFVKLKRGLPFLFITPEMSIKFLIWNKSFGPITELINKVKLKYDI